MSYRFELPAAIESDIYDCAIYIARDAPQRAIAWVDQIITRLVSIADLPHAYPLSEGESNRLGRPVHKFTIGNYVALYCVDEVHRVVEIVGFRHAARATESGPDSH